jgi:3-deoxy-D-manno-octulosonic-acid transferase
MDRSTTARLSNLNDGFLMPLVYNLLLVGASPLLLGFLAYRLLVQGKSREGFLQRLGWAPCLPGKAAGGRVWLHAVSAGEVVAAAAIARQLARKAPETQVVISTTTPAGRQQAQKLLPQAAACFYFPFDFLPCVACALWRVRPSVVAAVETEIWPNWLWLSRLMGVRTALLNGQFADRGFGGARRARWFYRWALGRIEALWMQTAQAARRAQFLGADPARVRVVGNVKFEQEVPPPQPEVETAVRQHLGLSAGRPLWVAGSTHPGEEEQVLQAYRLARERIPDLALLLAPRHTNRAGDVLALVRAEGWKCARRTERAGEPVDVLILDTMGELAGLYALAEVVFVGGSLVPVGGHDILQPLFHGKPALFGPHMHNQHDLAALALHEQAVVQVADAPDLAAWVVRLCTDEMQAQQMKRAGEQLLSKNRGAAEACADLLARLAEGREPL